MVRKRGEHAGIVHPDKRFENIKLIKRPNYTARALREIRVPNDRELSK